ncbi:MAG: hypothetical protein P4L67_04940 [Candidatus Pacebacteria bacterium]|nr:hypothetical protein [Candidatus Paceibacterota bacterium]
MVRGPSLGSKRLTNKPASAEAILAHVLKKLGWTARYNKGQLDGHERLRLLEAIRAFSKAWIKHEAQQFARSQLDWNEGRSLLGPAEDEQVGRSLREQAGRFFKRIKGFVRESIVAGAMGLLGPRALTSDELQQAERQAVTQDAYLDRFQADMLRPQPFNPDKTLEVFIFPAPITANQFIARAESYGACAWGCSQEIARATYARNMVFDQERLVLGEAEHCGDCLEDSARGFVPIGSLRSIGDRQCRQNCHCHLTYRLGDDGEEFIVAP